MKTPTAPAGGSFNQKLELQAHQRILSVRLGWRETASGLLSWVAEANEESSAGGARLSERGRWSFGNFDGAVEKIFAGGEELDLRAGEALSEQALAEGVRGVGVEAEVAVEQIGVGVVVKLAAAQAALQAEGSDVTRAMRAN